MAHKQPQHVTFDAVGRVFKLTAGSSLYAMRVSEVGTLEHLYWGPALPADVDLRYIVRGNVAQPFDPSQPTFTRPMAEEKKTLDQLRTASNAALAELVETKKTLLSMWREHRGAADGEKSKKKSNSNSTFERRLENMTWRLLAMNKLGDERFEGRAAELLRERPLVARTQPARDEGGVEPRHGPPCVAERGGGAAG